MRNHCRDPQYAGKAARRNKRVDTPTHRHSSCYGAIFVLARACSPKFQLPSMPPGHFRSTDNVHVQKHGTALSSPLPFNGAAQSAVCRRQEAFVCPKTRKILGVKRRRDLFFVPPSSYKHSSYKYPGLTWVMIAPYGIFAAFAFASFESLFRCIRHGSVESVGYRRDLCRDGGGVPEGGLREGK